MWDAKNPEACSTWIIGYGNPLRRDDGIGPYVIERLDLHFGSMGGVALRSLHQLDPVVAEELQGAKVLILVDATVEPLERGLRWARVHPRRDELPWGTHHLRPSVFAGLLEALYERAPVTWLVSVQGNDFGYGEGLSQEGREKAEKASREIMEFCSREFIDKVQGSVNDRRGASREKE